MFLKGIKQALFNKFKQYEAQAHELSYLFWELTQRCNLNCLHCGSDCQQISTISDMPLSDFLKVLENINLFPHKFTTVVLTGGEPLLRVDLENCIYQIRKRNFGIGMVTNGLFYTKEKHFSLLNAGLGSLTLSLDGFESLHNWLRGNNKSFQAAVSAIELIVESKNINFDVVTCVNKKNLSELENFCDFLISKKVKAWRLFTIFPIGRAKNNENLFLNAKEFLFLMKFIEKCRREKNISVNFSCEGFVGRFEGEVRDSFFFCRAGIHIASVLINGDVSACPNIDRSFVQGNIYQNDFMTIWNHQFQVFRDRSWTKVGKCKSCKSYKLCNGNGFHYWDSQKNEVLFCHNELISEV